VAQAPVSTPDGGVQVADERFWSLADRYRGELLNQALAILGRAEDAEDVVQETLCEAFRRQGELFQVQSVGAYLRAINRANALNRVRDERRLAARSDRKQQEAPERPFTTGGFSLVEMRESVAVGIEALPEELRAVVVCRFWDHLSYEEIALRLNLSPLTVRRRLYKAVTSLHRELGRFVGGEGGRT
jgi:RNA polymerase sigma-70 factor (ECF subfamily)